MRQACFLFFVFLAWAGPNAHAQQTPSEAAAPEQYRTARELFRKGKYPAAFELFGQYRKRPDAPADRKASARYYQAKAALKLYNRDAELLYLAFIDRYPAHPKAPQARLDLANFYFNDQNYEKAIEWYKKAPQEGVPEKEKNQSDFRLAYAFLSKNADKKALKHFNQVKRKSGPYKTPATYYAGFLNYSQKNYEAAAQDLESIQEEEDYQNLVPAMLANIYFQQGDCQQVLSYGQKHYENTGLHKSHQIGQVMGICQYRQENYEEAREYFQAFQQQYSGKLSLPMSYRLGMTELQTGHYEAAAEHLKKVGVAREDTLAQYASYYLGIAFLRLGKLSYASGAFQQARQYAFAEEITAKSTFMLAKTAFDLDNYQKAINTLKTYLEKYPEGKSRQEANELLSEAYLQTNDYDQAIAFIESVDNRTSPMQKAYQEVTFRKGAFLFNDQQFQDCIGYFTKSLKYPHEQNLVYRANLIRADAYSTLGKWQKAEQDYSSVLGFRNLPEDLERRAHYGAGYALFNQNQYPEAKSHFQQFTGLADKKDEGYHDGLLRLADCQYATKNYQQAIGSYQRAIERKNPEADYAWYQLGIVHATNEEPQAAREAFQEVIDGFPQSIYREEATYQLAQLEFEQGNYNKAVAQFTEIIQSQPSDPKLYPYLYMNRALAYSNVNNQEKAIQDYEYLLKNYPAHKKAHSALIGLQEALNNTGRIEEFDQYMARYKEANPESDALESIDFETAKGLFYSQKYEKAIRKLKNYLKQYKESAYAVEAKFYLAESYYRNKQDSLALPLYKKLLSSGKNYYMNKSAFRLAEIHYEQGRYQKAIAHYKKYFELSRNRKQQFYSWQGQMKSYLELEKLDSAQYYAETILEKESIPIDIENKAYLVRAKVDYKKGNMKAAMDGFISTVNNAQDANAAEAQYYMGQIQHRQGQYEQSLNTLYDLNKNFSAYKYWYDKSFLLIAENFIALDEILQAKATLNSIISNSNNDETIAEARKKLERLKEEAEKAAPQPDTSNIDTTAESPTVSPQN